MVGLGLRVGILFFAESCADCKHYAETIFVNQGYRVPVYGILKKFAELNFHSCGRSAKTTKIMRLENLALYGLYLSNALLSGGSTSSNCDGR